MKIIEVKTIFNLFFYFFLQRGYLHMDPSGNTILIENSNQGSWAKLWLLNFISSLNYKFFEDKNDWIELFVL